MRDRALINQKINGRMEKGGSYDTRRPLYRSAPALGCLPEVIIPQVSKIVKNLRLSRSLSGTNQLITMVN